MTKKTQIVVARAQAAIAAQPNPDATLPESVTSSTRVLSSANPTVLSDGTVAGGRLGTSKWKRERSKFTSMVKLTKSQMMTYEKRMELKKERDAMKEQEASYKALMSTERKDEARRIEQRRKQREENEKKSMITQKITNTKKLKKLTPKQMRQIIKM